MDHFVARPLRGVLIFAATLVACSSLAVVDGTDEPVDATRCDNPTSILQANTDIESGFVRCDDGFIKRTSAVTCVDARGVGPCTSGGECASDGECTARANGTCHQGDQLCSCRYGCATDADCGTERVCVCAGVIDTAPRCVPASCFTDSDCVDGLCGLSQITRACGDVFARMTCVSAESSCRVDANCEAAEAECNPSVRSRCASRDGEWSCDSPNCGPCG